MKTSIRMTSAIIALILTLSFASIPAFAATDNIGVSPSPSYLNEFGIQTYSTSEPKNEWNLSTKGKYSFSGSAKYSGLYTNYYFTGVSKVKIYVKNKGTGTMEVDFLKKAFINSTISSVDVTKNSSTTYTISSLDKAKKYMIYFLPCGDFEGYIVKA